MKNKEEMNWANIYRKDFKLEKDIMKLQDAIRIKMSVYDLLQETKDKEYEMVNGRLPEKAVNQMINFALLKGIEMGKSQGFEHGHDTAMKEVADKLGLCFDTEDED